MLVWASPVDDHAKFHEINLIDAKSKELNEKMTEVMKKDPTLEPSTVLDKVLNNAELYVLSRSFFSQYT